jgi:hypothetical protein
MYRLDPSSDDALLGSEALEDVESLQHFYSTDVSSTLCIHITIFSTYIHATYTCLHCRVVLALNALFYYY